MSATSVNGESADASVGPDVPVEHLDFLIVGAGLSGIGAACHLERERPGTSYAIFEGRGALGGTWDLFRYPGLRSDSDMYTLGYSFRPWTKDRSIADGASILQYIHDAADEHGVEQHIRYHHKVLRAEWSAADARWSIDAERSDTGEAVRLTCGFLLSCSGYYRYDQGYQPDFAGTERFSGRIVHPQHWPEDLDYEGKQVVVIGSGATAVTLVPTMATKAAHVIMLQRSPTYIIAMPGSDAIANAFRRVLPTKAAYVATRWKNVIMTSTFYQLCRRRPKVVKKVLRKGLERQLPKGYDIDAHFTPRYDPWDQRLCVVPDGDLFRAIRKGDVSVVTDRIATFTEHGIQLESGNELAADIVVSATGLNLLAFGGLELVVDGSVVNLPDTMAYKGMMLSGVPNFAYVVGYTNASWTLKADLVCEYVCRLAAHMEATGTRICTPEADASVTEEPFMDFSAGYVLRSIDAFPKQGSKAPWKLHQNYVLDLLALRRSGLEDEAMTFTNPPKVPATSTAG